MTLSLRRVGRAEALQFLASARHATHQQCPSWAGVNPGWRAELLGWFDESGMICGYAAVMIRTIPGLRRFLAYLPEGPLVAWDERSTEEWLAPLVDHLRASGAFAVKISPRVVHRVWEASTVKDAVRSAAAHRFADVLPDDVPDNAARMSAALQDAGWRRQLGRDHLGVTDLNFELPLKGRDRGDLWGVINRQWRRNITKAEQAGVTVTRGGTDDVGRFYRIHRETAGRNGFPVPSQAYFEKMALDLAAEEPGRVRVQLAVHQGDLLASGLSFHVGSCVGCAYSGSSAVRREVQPATLMHWRSIGDSVDAGAEVYDFRGVADTLDAEDPGYGILGFKLGTNGQVVEHVGEWDLALDATLYRAVRAYHRRRRARVT